MKRYSVIPIVIVAMLLAACSASTGPTNVDLEPVALPVAHNTACPVTQRPATPFIPPAPYPTNPPPGSDFWYGDAKLWTALTDGGEWAQLALGEKFWWWSADFDVGTESEPALVVTARRLDGEAPEFESDWATNGSHPTLGTAMLVGVTLPTRGCWEITGRYKGHELVVVQFVP